MTVWAVVPVKPLRRSKSRLSHALGVEERQALSKSLLTHTLDCLAQAEAVDRIAVVSGDPAVRAMACNWETVFVEDPPQGGLNQALNHARQAALRGGAAQVLVLPADLPRLTPEAINQLTGLVDGPPCVVIAPDRHGSGTNALLLAPPALIEYAFGPLSFFRHLQLAEAAGVQPRVCQLPALALDLDLPEDLRLLSEPAPLAGTEA
ncbi:MAG: 2-phospho-L-lactate guanylyltransferase [Anaerolineales bacterium]|nr:2-phospho-L-lactate guanylyltransferase [Anaerolineales bacterium]